MGNAVKPIPTIPTQDDLEFVVDLARFAEGIADEAALRKKYSLSEAIWTQLADDDELVRAIDREKERRVRDGSHKREKAQKHVIRGVDVLDSIAADSSASPKHRVDAIKTLDGMANGPGASAPAGDRFVITINLGADTETFSKSIEINANDVDPHHPNDVPMVAAIAAKKTQGGDDGGPNAI